MGRGDRRGVGPVDLFGVGKDRVDALMMKRVLVQERALGRGTCGE